MSGAGKRTISNDDALELFLAAISFGETTANFAADQIIIRELKNDALRRSLMEQFDDDSLSSLIEGAEAIEGLCADEMQARGLLDDYLFEAPTISEIELGIAVKNAFREGEDACLSIVEIAPEDEDRALQALADVYNTILKRRHERLNKLVAGA